MLLTPRDIDIIIADMNVVLRTLQAVEADGEIKAVDKARLMASIARHKILLDKLDRIRLDDTSED